MPRTAFMDFQDLLRDISQMGVWVMPAAGVTPVLAALADVSPPWPNKLGITVAASIVMMLGLLATFHFLPTRGRTAVNRTIFRSLLIAIASGITYFFIFSLFTYQTPVTKEWFIKGFSCTKEATSFFGDKCPWLDLDELKMAEYEASRLWTWPSIALTRLALLLLWFALCLSGAAALGAFVRYQKNQKSQSKPQQP
jgi:hypothetical protein